MARVKLRRLLWQAILVVGSISLAVSMTLLVSPLLYRLYCAVTGLAASLHTTSVVLERNYLAVYRYLLVPWQSSFAFPDFVSSTGGMQHFIEVKHLCQLNGCLSLGYLILLGWLQYRKRWQQVMDISWRGTLVSVMYLSAGVVMAVLVAFDTLFIWFHQLLFRNELWQFNPQTDPVIWALPEGYFLLLALVGLIVYYLQLFGWLRSIHWAHHKNTP